MKFISKSVDLFKFQGHIAALPVGYTTTPECPSFQSLKDKTGKWFKYDLSKNNMESVHLQDVFFLLFFKQ